MFFAALWCWIGYPPKPFRRYFLAVMVYTLCVHGAYSAFGHSLVYRWVYFVCTWLVLLPIVGIAAMCLTRVAFPIRPVVIAGVLAGTLVRIAYLDLPHPLSPMAWISLSEGFVLALTGILASMAAPKTQYQGTIFLMGFLWICQSVFRFGYALHATAWRSLNAWAPGLILLVGLLAIGWSLQHVSARDYRLS